MHSLTRMRIEIGMHAIGIADDAPAEHGADELCVMAIGMQPIGNCVVHAPDGGRYVSATRLHGYGRTSVGAYVEVDPDREIYSTGTADRHAAPTIAVALVAAIVIVALGRATLSATRAIAALTWRSTRSYVRREVTSQWRFVACLSIPIACMAAWILNTRGG